MKLDDAKLDLEGIAGDIRSLRETTLDFLLDAFGVVREALICRRESADPREYYQERPLEGWHYLQVAKRAIPVFEEVLLASPGIACGAYLRSSIRTLNWFVRELEDTYGPLSGLSLTEFYQSRRSP